MMLLDLILDTIYAIYHHAQVMIIGSDNVFEVGSCSHSLKIGDHNVVEAKWASLSSSSLSSSYSSSSSSSESCSHSLKIGDSSVTEHILYIYNNCFFFINVYSTIAWSVWTHALINAHQNITTKLYIIKIFAPQCFITLLWRRRNQIQSFPTFPSQPRWGFKCFAIKASFLKSTSMWSQSVPW